MDGIYRVRGALFGALVGLVAGCGEPAECFVGPTFESVEYNVTDPELAELARASDQSYQSCVELCPIEEVAPFNDDIDVQSCSFDGTADPVTSPGTEGGASDDAEHYGVMTCDVYKKDYCVGGRGHGSIVLPSATQDGGAGTWLANMATAEHGSIAAFEAVADELAAFNAPTTLVRRAKSAASDEARHTELVAELAQAYGASFTPARRRPFGARTLEAFAIENAVEGCVRETWAALEACHQARFASDPAVRAAMLTIAHDESQHAELAWAIHRWAIRQLSRDARARVEAALRDAAQSVQRELLSPARPHDARLGLPGGEAAIDLLAALRHSVLEPALAAA